MLTTLAIINMAVAAALINETIEIPASQQEPTEIVATAGTETSAE